MAEQRAGEKPRGGIFGLGGGAAAQPVFLTGVGLRCALGLSALQAAMLVRARMGEPRATRFKDKRGRHVGLHAAAGLPADLQGCDRMIALGAPALRAAVEEGAASSGWPMFLAVPEKGRPDDDARLDGGMVAALSEASGVPLDTARSRIFRAGHAGGAFAVAAAVEELSKGAQAVIVGGVDSYHHPEVLAWLDEECRLHAMDAENGFVPGEAGAFLVLTSKLAAVAGRAKEARGSGADVGHASRGGAPVLLRRAVVGQEETVLADEANIGAAMTGLLRELAAAAPGERLAWSLTDVNGERHRVREWALASGRGVFAEEAVHDRPAEDLGDLGAASGAALAALACALFRVGGAPKSTACVAVASEGAERGAFLLSFEGAGR